MRALVPHEPRLGRKLSAPLARLIDTTGAKSLQYECLLTVASVMHEDTELLALAARKLSEFVAADDANLKFLGLVALAELQAADAALVDDGCREAVLRSTPRRRRRQRALAGAHAVGRDGDARQSHRGASRS